MKKELARELVDFAQSRVKLSRFSALMGFEVEKLFEGGAVLRMTTEDHHRQIHNVMHGGVIAALADTAGAIAAYTVVPRGTEVVTVELKINYLVPVGGGEVWAEGKVLRAGRNFVAVECDITNQEGAMVAKALMTFGAAPGHEIGGANKKKGSVRIETPRTQKRSTR
jgi:acyl-CoA thioesterase